jgi:hypothetical protein
VHEDDLCGDCLKHLRTLPFVRAAVVRDDQLRLTTLGATVELPIEVRRTHLQKESAGHLIHLSRQKPGLVVMAHAVGRQLGDLFEREGVGFVDRSGNCHLQIGNEYVARIQGRTSSNKKRASARAFRAPTYRALFALLVQPELIDDSARAMAAVAGVSPQTANALRHSLVERGLVLEAGKKHRWAPGRRAEVVDLWLHGFATTLAPSLLIGHYRAREEDPRALEARIIPILDATGEWRFGGGAAAMRLTGYYRGDETVIYFRDPPPDLAERLRFIPDERGPIAIARPPCDVAFVSPDAKCVHPLLAYADLLAENHERASDAAEVLHERFLSEEEP